MSWPGIRQRLAARQERQVPGVERFQALQLPSGGHIGSKLGVFGLQSSVLSKQRKVVVQSRFT